MYKTPIQYQLHNGCSIKVILPSHQTLLCYENLLSGQSLLVQYTDDDCLLIEINHFSNVGQQCLKMVYTQAPERCQDGRAMYLPLAHPYFNQTTPFLFFIGSKLTPVSDSVRAMIEIVEVGNSQMKTLQSSAYSTSSSRVNPADRQA